MKKERLTLALKILALALFALALLPPFVFADNSKVSLVTIDPPGSRRRWLFKLLKRARFDEKACDAMDI